MSTHTSLMKLKVKLMSCLLIVALVATSVLVLPIASGTVETVYAAGYGCESLPLPMGGSVGGKFNYNSSFGAASVQNEYFFWAEEGSNLTITYTHPVYAVTDEWAALSLTHESDGKEIKIADGQNLSQIYIGKRAIIRSSIATSTIYYYNVPDSGLFTLHVDGNYYGGRGVNESYTISLTDTIPISLGKFYSIPSAYYSGSAVNTNPVITMYDKVLTNGVDYYIDGYTNNDKVGTASAKIVGMGKYSGSKSFTYKILPKPYKVTFNENGGQAVSDKDVGYGAAAGTLPTPTRTGYTFAGWYTAASGGSKITSSTQVTEAVTCYAHWTIKNYSVAFNSNGGGSVAGRSVQHGANIGSLSTPTRTGYTFAGWYTSSYGGSRISAYSKVYGAATVHAHWTAKKYALKLNVNGGKKLKASKAKKTVTYAGKYGSLTKPTKKGYKFKGWYTKKSGGSKITSGSTVTILKSTTLYAHWKKK